MLTSMERCIWCLPVVTKSLNWICAKWDFFRHGLSGLKFCSRWKLKSRLLFYKIYSPPSQLNHPQNDQIPFPLCSSTVMCPLISPPHRSSVNLVGCCVQSSIGGRLKARQILFYLFFCAKFWWLKRLDSVLPYRHRPARCLSILYPNVKAAFRLVVVSSHPEKAIENQGPIALSIFIFFVAPFATQSDE